MARKDIGLAWIGMGLASVPVRPKPICAELARDLTAVRHSVTVLIAATA